MRSVHRQRDRRTWRNSSFVLGFLFVGGCMIANKSQSGPSANVANNPAAESARETILFGAWRLLQTGVRVPGQPWDVRRAPQGGLFVFSGHYYSYFYIRGDNPRPRFTDANRPTDAERAATYATFIAGAGSYTFDGKTVSLKSDFSKNPNEMTGELWRLEAEFAGDTLRLLFANPPFLPGRDWLWTLVRIE